ALEKRFSTRATKEIESAKKAGTVKTPLMQVVETIVPSNPFAAVSGVPANPSLATEPANPNMLHLMFFALVIGVAITLLPVKATAPLLSVLEAVYEITA